MPVLVKEKAERYSLSVRRKASDTWRQHRLRKETGDLRIWALLERQSTHVGQAIAISCYQPFGIMVHIHIFLTITNLVTGITIALLLFDHMAFLLDLW